ncbi:MAG: hypothetical protein LBT79_01230, partial [Elusimicrobiota bacterium]|nr:hypothetical protein [Elusimicrobiota bacterium]
MLVSIISSIILGIAVFMFIQGTIKWLDVKQKEAVQAKKGSFKDRFLSLPPKRQMFIIVLVIFLIVLLISSKIIFAVIASAAFAYFQWNSQKKKDKKLSTLIDSQVIESLTTIKSAILAGQSLQNAIITTAHELKEPIKSDFERISDELVLGVDFDIVLLSASQKARSKEFRFMIDTIRLSKDTGASLSGIFDRII